MGYLHIPGVLPLVPTELQVGRAPQQVWAFFIRKQYVVPTWNGNTIHRLSSQ